MKISLYYLLVLPIVFLPILFNSCAKKLDLDKEILYSKSSCPKPEGLTTIDINSKLKVQNLSPFQANKLQLDKNMLVNTAQQKLSPDQNHLPTGYSLTLIFNSNCAASGVSETIKTFDLNLKKQISEFKNTFAYSLKLNKDYQVNEISSLLNNDECVVGGSPTRVYTQQFSDSTDPYFSKQKPYYDSIDHIQAFENISTNSELSGALNQSVKVAVIDTGVDYNHPDLKQNMIQLNNGYWGYDTTQNSTNPNDPMDKSTEGHGTHVAGIIAATQGNSKGISGLAPFSKILAINVFGIKPGDVYGADSSDVYNGIQKAIAENVDIINLSIGVFSTKFTGDASYLQGLVDAVKNNILVVTVIGNDSGESDSRLVDGVNLTVIPGIYGAAIDGVLTVASVDANTNSLSSFSLYSQVYAEIAAPGSVGSGSSEGIFSTTRSTDSTVPYAYMRGTSMAAPVVSSVAALAVAVLKHQGKSYSAKDIENLLKLTAHRSYKLECTVRDNQIVNSLNLVEYLMSN